MSTEINPEQEFRKQQGKLLRKARKTADYSQEQAGEYIGVSQDSISNFERGTQAISPYKLLQFAKLYNKPVTFFYMTEVHKF